MYNWYWENIGWKINYFFQGIKNIIKWIPIIYKDKNWDDFYIYEILQFKLKQQAKYIGGRDFHTRAERDAEIMMTCVRLIEKLKEEYYTTEYQDYYKMNWTTLPVEDKPELIELKSDIVWEKLDNYFSKYPLVYKKMFKYDDKLRIALRMGSYRHDKARKLLFTLLERNIESFWD